jgi:restriction system protein
MAHRVYYKEYLADSCGHRAKAVDSIEERTFRDPRLFFSRCAWCPFCDSATAVVYEDFYLERFGPKWWEAVSECQICGWWEYQSRWAEGGSIRHELKDLRWVTLRYAIVRRYDTSPHEKPVAELIREVAQGPELLYSIQPRQLEQIAQYVFSAHYQCNALHVGKSHDGGVDLLLVDSDNPILVQVKRRSSPRSSEAVSTVREFIGTMYLNSASRGIVLSTANSFSRESKRAAASIMDSRKFTTFELVDYNRFVEMLNAVAAEGGQDYKPWKEQLRIPGLRERKGGI